MHDRTAIHLLLQELENDHRHIEESYGMLKKAVFRASGTSWEDELDLMCVGACLHGLYNAIDAYFFRVAKFFENCVDQQAWHRDLLDRMTLEIPDVRPALIADSRLAERIDELRRFRHLFRNLYKTRLSVGKLKIVCEAAEGLGGDFSLAHGAFTAWLGLLAQAL